MPILNIFLNISLFLALKNVTTHLYGLLRGNSFFYSLYFLLSFATDQFSLISKCFGVFFLASKYRFVINNLNSFK